MKGIVLLVSVPAAIVLVQGGAIAALAIVLIAVLVGFGRRRPRSTWCRSRR